MPVTVLVWLVDAVDVYDRMVFRYIMSVPACF